MLSMSESLLFVRLLNTKVSNIINMVSILFVLPSTNGYAGVSEPSCPLINFTDEEYPVSVIISGIYAGAIPKEVALGGI